MPCHHPIPAWRNAAGTLTLREPRSELPSAEYLRLPCGTCLGCRLSRAREWALRCSLELSLHDHACWTTLTYDDAHLPPTLDKSHLSGFIKRLRARVEPARIRFFASGEYGERTARPHYHAILYGVSDSPHIPAAWPFGFARVDPLTPAAIAYVAGYCAKKVGWKLELGERVDPTTGEVYEYQPPFLLMSRNPGIAGAHRSTPSAWRRHAVYSGQLIPAPRYLHESWLNSATTDDISKLKEEKALSATDSTKARLQASAHIALAKHNLSQAKRQKL
ncbi:MAG: replication initiator protein [Microvirus sp.]|nr:MAG: replication initiator protein [Microvirus sp.]